MDHGTIVDETTNKATEAIVPQVSQPLHEYTPKRYSCCWNFLNILIFVMSVILSWWVGHTRILDDFIPLLPTSGDSLRRSPYIDEKNASYVLKRRQALVLTEFESAIASKGWKVLRSSANITIETLEAADGWPPYVRTTAFIPCSPETVFDAFKWSNFHKTQSAIDPFYQSSEVVLEGSRTWRVIRKSTKRPLIYPKREFYLATIDTKSTSNVFTTVPPSMQQQSDGTEPESRENSHGTTTGEGGGGKGVETMLIPRGTMMSILVSVRMSDEFLDQRRVGASEKAKERYVQGFQDFVGWFLPVPGGTRLVLVMRVDVGADIPKWAFMAVVAATGIPAMRSLSDYVTR